MFTRQLRDIPRKFPKNEFARYLKDPLIESFLEIQLKRGDIMVYRRLKDSPDPDWHFHTKCPGWPELGLVEAQLLKPDDDHICPEFIKLDAIPPRQPPSAGGPAKKYSP